MVDWKRTSERNLVYQLLRGQSTEEEQAKAYAELQHRLERLFQAAAWQSLKPYQEDIIGETIARLLEYYPDFRGHSRAYRKFIRKTFICVCADTWKSETLVQASLDDPVSPDGADSSGRTLVDVLSVGLGPESKDSVSSQWSDANDSMVMLSPERLAEHLESQGLIRQARAGLSEHCRHILAHEEGDDQSQKQMARKMRISHGSLRVQLHRCRKELLRQLIQMLASSVPTTQAAKIASAIAQLPEPPRRMIQAWWQGNASLRALGKLYQPPLSQHDTKRSICKGLLQLMSLLNELERDQEVQIL